MRYWNYLITLSLIIGTPLCSYADFKPEFKEAACKLVAKDKDDGIFIGLGYPGQERSKVPKLMATGREYTFETIDYSVDKKDAETFIYWRPFRNHIYLYGHTNNCTVEQTHIAKGVKGKFNDPKRISKKIKGKGCCMIWQHISRKSYTTSSSAISGPLSNTFYNQGYISGWFNRKDCSSAIPVSEKPDFIQSILPKPKELALEVMVTQKDPRVIGWFAPIHAHERKYRLGIDMFHGGRIKASCDMQNHLFTKRPPPHPYHKYSADANPPFKEISEHKPYVEKAQFNFPTIRQDSYGGFIPKHE